MTNNPLIINLYGAPGSGKSTTRAGIFRILKLKQINCEEVTEFAKALTWEERQKELEIQPYVFANQLKSMEILKNKVDVIITDSPLLLSYYYGKTYSKNRYSENFYNFILDEVHKENSLNIMIKRVKPYNPIGRNQIEGESDKIHYDIISLLERNDIVFHEVDGDEEASSKIAYTAMEKLQLN